MPYSNIVFIKLFVSLFEEDDRFLYQLNESQQLLYIKLLYLAATTENRISKNYRFISHKVNYNHEEDCLLADIKRIADVFPRFKDHGKYHSFENFEELHNYILRKDKGTPKEIQRNSKGSYQKKNKNKKENKKKNKNKKENKKKNKNIYGEFVYLSIEEHSNLTTELGSSRLEALITDLNNYIGSTGKKYKSHYHTILTWHRKDTKPKLTPAQQKSINSLPKEEKQ